MGRWRDAESAVRVKATFGTFLAASPLRLAVMRRSLLAAVAASVTVGLSAPAAFAAPEPSDQSVVVGGTLEAMNKERTIGATLEAVRVYRTWSNTTPSGLPSLTESTEASKLASYMGAGKRTLMYSAGVPWHSWMAEAKRLNGDGDPTNNVADPYCKWKPKVATKSWFKSYADGDYDAELRTWLRQFNDLAASVPEIYLSILPEADRLDASPAAAKYQRCVGTAADVRAAWQRMVNIAGGRVVGGASLNAMDRTGGKIRWVPVMTDWAFTHTSGATSPERELVNFRTGLPPANATGADATLTSSRATPWMPPVGTYDYAGIDVFNFSGAIAGITVPTRIKVDDPATAVLEEDRWRSLDVITRAVLLWARHNAPMPDGQAAPIYIAELGSVPDPTRPGRRAAWLDEGCRFVAQEPRIRAVLYFDANTMRLNTWNWKKRSDGGWDATAPATGVDTVSAQALGRWLTGCATG